MPTEKTITTAITAYLKSIDCWYVKVFGSHRGRAGVPDLLVCRKGLFYAIEIKRPGGKGPTKIQDRELAAIIGAGGLAFVARSVDDVRRVMDAERRSVSYTPRNARCFMTPISLEEAEKLSLKANTEDGEKKDE